MTEMQPMPQPHRKKDEKGETPSTPAPRTTAPQLIPHHIVIFPEPAAANAGRVADILRAERVGDDHTRNAHIVMAATRPGDADTHFYHQLGIATLDLSPEERASFERIDGVQVVENQMRELPPVIDASDAAIEIASSAHVARGPDAEHPRRRAKAQPGTNWCLDLIGVATHERRWTGREITVAVLDTGIDVHPDLTRVKAKESFVPGEDAQDENGHGTHCAGIVAAARPSGSDLPYGVAPDVELLVAKVLNRLGRGWDNQILNAIDWAADLGADVVSMSLVTARAPGERYPAQYEAVAKALRQRVLFVAAAGNDSREPHYVRPVGSPASCPSIISVGAVNRHRQVAPFSCREIDAIGRLGLCAPGVAVHSAWLGGGYKLLSGTSMATPHVAALAALFAERGGPSMRGAALRQRLIDTARHLGDRRDFGYGLATF